MKILVTGAAGFIGMHASAALLRGGHAVIGVDNLNDYYPVSLKRARLAELEGLPGFDFRQGDIADADWLAALFESERPQRVLHLAAQAGVRYSLINPQAYLQSNLVGFGNVLEGCRHTEVEHLVYASSSSVYGANRELPFRTTDRVDNPVSLYAATKKSNELMAHSYTHLYGLPTTGLRYFTVYGPWGRPDMSPWLFTSAILEGRPIDVFNHGDMQRDFTYIDDIVDGTLRVLERPPAAGYALYNIGNSQPEQLMDFIGTLESVLGREAQKRLLPMQPGDVQATYADISDLERDTGFRIRTSLRDGLTAWAQWFRAYHALDD